MEQLNAGKKKKKTITQPVAQRGPNHLYSLVSFLNHELYDKANYLDFIDQIQRLIGYI